MTGVVVTKRIVFQIHWLLGITAGLVLALMGVTGAMMSFEDEIREAVDPALFAPGVPAAPDLSPDQLIARIEAAKPGYRVTRLDWQMPRTRSHSVRLNAASGQGRLEGQVDRATGRWLGPGRADAVFETIDHLHRWLALPGGGKGPGRQITGFSALALIFFALSGLYLRWPRQASDWRAWLVLDRRKTGRNLWRALHAVIGTWMLAFYLLSALTGLWWSYDWYRQGVTQVMTGKAGADDEPAGKRAPGLAPRPPVDLAWAQFRATTGDHYAWVRIARPPADRPMKTIRFEARRADARHLRQTDIFTYDPAASTLVKRDLYARRPLGTVITQSMFELHRGAFFGLPGRIVMLVTSLAMPLFAVTGLLLYLSRRRQSRAAKALARVAPEANGGPDAILIAYASQTGFAAAQAHAAAHALAQGGVGAKVVSMGRLTAADLAQASRALLVVSTYGDGEAPDAARGFARQVMRGPRPDLGDLRYGVLAIGDSEYGAFCAFGREVDAWLSGCAARPLFPLVALDRRAGDGAQGWQEALKSLGAADIASGEASAFAQWRLVDRTVLNPASTAAPVFHLRFQPPRGHSADWQAGDIVEVQAAAPGAPVRSYSAASIGADGTLDVVVRQVVKPDGTLGVGSGWLTATLPLGSTTSARLRRNPSFHAASDGQPLILIGNGTGIAGLRAHLRAQSLAGSKGHWLLYGERTQAHEAFFAEELAGWLGDGTLARLDRVFSRDPDCGRYVQHRVSEAADTISAFVAAGATILVCGSLEGMASGVDAALQAILGEEQLQALAEAGRYKRDVY
nr:sulfite reductase flavoprotein subunit alpha [Novosphingobium sp. SG919]